MELWATGFVCLPKFLSFKKGLKLKKLISLVSNGILFITLICWLYIIFRLVKYTDNHVGWNPLLLCLLFGVLAALSGFIFYSTKKKIQLLIFIYSLFSAGTIYYFYSANILLPYEVWTERGMPERPF